MENLRKFINNLDISKEIKDILGVLKVCKAESSSRYRIEFSIDRFISLEEARNIIESLKKITLPLNPNQTKFIFNSNLEKYVEFIFYIELSKIIKNNKLLISNSDYYVKNSKDKLLIYTSSNGLKNEILNLCEKYKFEINSLFKKNLSIIVDKDNFNRTKTIETLKHHKNKLTKKDDTFFEDIDQQPKNGYKELNTKNNYSDQKNIYVEGFVFKLEVKQYKRGHINTIWLKSKYFAIKCTLFSGKDDKINIKENDLLRIYGNTSYSEYDKLRQVEVSFYEKINNKILKVESRKDTSEIKRIEFSLHTKMSIMDGVTDISDYIKQAKDWGWKGIGITDHDVVQSFPFAAKTLKKDDNFKIIYGSELNVYDDVNTKVVINKKNDLKLKDEEYVIFDLETTGISPFVNEIIEFGGVKYKKGQITETLQLFLKPSKPINENITNITNISNQMVNENGYEMLEGLERIKDWIGDSILVAHNAEFDFNFLNHHLKKNNLGKLFNPVIDTLKVAWYIYRKKESMKSFRLGTLARLQNINYEDSIAHRADYDAKVLQSIFENFLVELANENIYTLGELDLIKKEIENKYFSKHISVIVKNQQGLSDLYKLISKAHIEFLDNQRQEPRIPLSYILEHRRNFLIGSACSNSFLWDSVNYQLEYISKVFNYYDYIEISPLESYQHLIDTNMFDKSELIKIIKEIYSYARKMNKFIIATGDVHFLNKEDKIIRDIYISNKGLRGKRHPLYNFRTKKGTSPLQYLMTTDEMLKSFEEIFSKEIANTLVVINTNILLDKIENVTPLKDKLYTPTLEGSREKLLNLMNKNLELKYGSNPEEIIVKRVNKEINSIVNNGYDIIYYLSSIAVRESIKNGYLVGSRGSVGSSLVAHLVNITEVNPLPAHYYCDKCGIQEFSNYDGSGFDLKEKNCPKCGSKFKVDGHNIPFETFLGFEGDKIPDIDLNFSREYQQKAHEHLKSVVGTKNVFRAGTISTVADRTAFGYINNYIEETNNQTINKYEKEYLVTKVRGTKRTTGQHPGGLMIVPEKMSVFDFTPINYPGNDIHSVWKTTHFDFHSIHDNLLKLDFLGHLDPSIIKFLVELTGFDSNDINMSDKKVLSLFENSNELRYKNDFTNEKTGILGIPEFGTKFVRELVHDSKPKTFSDLIRISGLSHGTGVWTDNAKPLVLNNIAKLRDLISTRDDIMTFLINNGIEKFMAFEIMESVRRGKGITTIQETELLKHNLPKWYVDSCKKINYMFPKAHATAYVMMAYKIAWYKIYYPIEYYSSFFSKRDVDFDLDSIFKGPQKIKEEYERIKTLGYSADQKEKSIMETYEIVLEFISRGFKIYPLDLTKSEISDWIISEERDGLIPPLTIIESLGHSLAEKIIKARESKQFNSMNDFINRTNINKTLLKKFKELHLFNNLFGIMEQTSLFD